MNNASILTLRKEIEDAKNEVSEVKSAFDAYKKKTRVATLKLQQTVASAKETARREELKIEVV